jgi:hypothetical protein
LADRHSLAIHVLLQRPAFKQLHDQELLPVVLSHVVNRADVRIVQRRCGVCFALEAEFRARFRGETRGQNLDGDVSVETCVSGTVNFAHPARTNGLFDFIRPQSCARSQVHRAAIIGQERRTGQTASQYTNAATGGSKVYLGLFGADEAAAVVFFAAPQQQAQPGDGDDLEAGYGPLIPHAVAKRVLNRVGGRGEKNS